jgi:hypothetical protein
VGSLPGIHGTTHQHPAVTGGLGMKKMIKFWVRLGVALRILFNRDKHWMYIYMNKEEFIELLKEEPVKFSVLYHGMQKYNLLLFLSKVSDRVEFVELVEEKARFEAEMDEWIKKI